MLTLSVCDPVVTLAGAHARQTTTAAVAVTGACLLAGAHHAAPCHPGTEQLQQLQDVTVEC